MCLTPRFVKGKYFACRKCVECRIQAAEEWSRRVVLEAKKYKENCFITLTYNEANLPEPASVCKRSAQLFIKRLRKAISPVKVRFFLCGEYGSERFSLRPHYHIILFNYSFPDKYFFKYDKRGNALYRSPLLEKIWTFGFSSIGEDLDQETAKYCAKYLQADHRTFEKLGLEPPFTLMSRKPGIALDNIPESVFKYGDIYLDGKRYRAPTAFLRKVKEQFPEYYAQILVHKGERSYKKLATSLGLKIDIDFLAQDESIRKLADDLFWQDVYNTSVDRESRIKKYKNIFGKSLDKDMRIVVSLKCSKKGIDEVKKN